MSASLIGCGIGFRGSPGGSFCVGSVGNPVAADSVAILRVVEASLRSPIWKMPPAPPEAVDPLLLRAITLAAELRALAAKRVAEPSHEAAYLMPLLEWMIPIVAFRQIERERKQLAAWSTGLVLERLLQVMELPEA